MSNNFDFDGAIEIALRTWYPKDHHLRLDPHHPLGKLVGEWGELLDDIVKIAYKPGFQSDLLSEMGDVWYYIRILCYQKQIKPALYEMSGTANKIVAESIRETSSAYLSLWDHGDYNPYCLNVSYSVLNVLLARKNVSLAELTELNWQKLKPGSQRGKEWKGESW